MNITESTVIAAPVDVVWRVAGDPGSLAVWLPGVEEVWFEDDVRHMRLAGGIEAGERITQRDESSHFYEYELAFGPMPVQSYKSRLSLRAHESGTEIIWVGEVVGESPELEEQLGEGLRSAYRGGLEGLRNLPAFT